MPGDLRHKRSQFSILYLAGYAGQHHHAGLLRGGERSRSARRAARGRAGLSAFDKDYAYGREHSGHKGK
jgi:hypothetical protein